MSFSWSRAATVVVFLAMAAVPSVPAIAIGQFGCVPDCANADAINRHNSKDPTDPVRFGEAKDRLSPSVGGFLARAQGYIDGGKFTEARDAAAKALGASNTDYEKLKSNQFLILANVDLNDMPAATVAAEAAADLPSIPDAEGADLYTNATILAGAAGHYQKAANYARKMQALKLNDARSQGIIDQALRNESKTSKP